MGDNFKINVEITGDDSKFQKTAKSSEKTIKNLEKEASDFSKVSENLTGIFADKFTNTGIGQLSSDLGKGTAAFEAFAGPAGIAATAITAVGGAAIYAGQTLWGLAKNASDYGSAIKDAQEITGLSVETLGTLRFAAEQGGKSFEDIISSVEKFTKKLGEAKNGNADAKKEMDDLGVTSYDLETALGQAFKAIQNNKEGLDQMNASQKVFGKTGAELLPVIKALNGDLAGSTEAAKKAALTLDQDAVDAADAFGDSLGKLSTQAQVTSAKFALEFAPEMIHGMDLVGNAFIQNQDTVRTWGHEIGNIIDGAVTSIKFLQGAVNGAMTAIGLDILNTKEKVTLLLGQFGLLGNMLNLFRYLGDKGTVPATRESWDNGKDIQGGSSVFVFGKQNPAIAKPSKSGSASPSGRKTNSVEQEMRKTFQELGFTVVRTFGQAINKGSLHPLGKAIDLSVKNKTVEDLFRAAIVGIQKGWQLVDERVPRVGKNGKPIKQTGPHFHFEKDSGTDPSLFLSAEAYGGQAQLDYLKKLDQARIAKTPLGEFEKTQSEVLQKQAEYVQKYLEAFNAVGDKTHLRVLELDKDFQSLSETQKEYLRGIADEWDALEKASKANDEYNQFISSLNQSYDDYMDVQESATERLDRYIANLKEAEVVLADGDEERIRYKAQVLDQAAAQKKFNDELEKTISRNKELTGSRGRYASGTRARVVPGQAITDASPEGYKSFGATVKDGFFGAAGINTAQRETDAVKAMYQDLGNTVADVFAGMMQGAQATLAAYIMTGEAGGQAFKQLTADIISALVIQSTIKAIFETAEGFAALARYDAYAASQHFHSAAIYGTVAAAAGVAAAVIGASGGLQGNSKNNQSGSPDYMTSSSAKTSSQAPDYLTGPVNSPSSDYLRQSSSQNAEIMSLKSEIANLSNTVSLFSDKVDTAKPGDIFVKGADQNRGIFANRTTEEIKRNPTAKNELGRQLGLK